MRGSAGAYASTRARAQVEGEGPAQGAAIALHAPLHRALGKAARVVFHTHQPWYTSLCCIKTGGLRMFHPDACIYAGRVGFDPVYTGTASTRPPRSRSTPR